MQAADLYAVSAQASVQVERARQAAKASVKAALSAKPKLELHLTFDAPKVAIPVPQVVDTEDGTGCRPSVCHCQLCHDLCCIGMFLVTLRCKAWACAGDLTLVLDFGNFLLQSDANAADTAPGDDASLYMYFQLGGRNISAYLVDGKFDWDVVTQDVPATLARGGDVATSLCGFKHLLQTLQHSVPFTPSHPGCCTQWSGRSTDGQALVVPLLDRCAVKSVLQLLRVPDAGKPALRLGLTLPSLNFHISPGRLHRIMRIVDAAVPSAPCNILLLVLGRRFGAKVTPGMPGAGSSASPAPPPVWRVSPEREGKLRHLNWGGLGHSTAQWQPRWAVLHHGSLYVLPSEEAKAAEAHVLSFWLGHRIVALSAEAAGGMQHCVAIVIQGEDVSKAMKAGSACVLRFASNDEVLVAGSYCLYVLPMSIWSCM